ncbi:PilW family protein [Desulfurobacterium sp.]
MRKALTLLELIIAIFAATFVMAAIYTVYNRFFSSYVQESSYQVSDVKQTLNLEILRQDIENAGFGIGKNETALPVEWDNAANKLILRTLYDILDEKTASWQMIDCSSGNFSVVVNKFSPGLVFSKAVYLNVNGTIAGVLDYSVCPGNNAYMVFPVLNATSACINQYCRGIVYELSTSSVPAYCANGTGELIRTVGGTTEKDSVFDCVGVFDVRFDWDLNGDGVIEPGEKSLPVTSIGSFSAADERKKLKLINVFIVVQQGKRRKRFRFKAQLKSGSQDFQKRLKKRVGSSWRHYQWKVIKLSVKPMNL